MSFCGNSESTVGRPISELETPALCIDLNELDRRLLILNQQLAPLGVRWRADVSRHQLTELAAWQLRGGACGIACGETRLAEPCRSSGPSSILLTQPLAADRQLERLATLPQSPQWLFVCDSFAQAERLSAAAGRSGRTLNLLMEVNIGRNRLGIRPGLDARDLARGVATLANVTLCGLSTQIGRLADDEITAFQQVQSADSILQELRDQMTRDGIECRTISLAAEGNLTALSGAKSVSEIRIGRSFFSDFDATPGRTAASIFLIATVISRPSLERATIDAGHSLLPLDAESHAFFRIEQTASQHSLPDVHIAHCDWATTTLELGPGSRNLIIGDQVEARPANPELALRLAQTIFATRNGTVEAVWHR